MFVYALKEAFSTMQRAKLTSLAATITLTVCLFLLGLFMMAYVNANAIVAKVRERVQIEAFLSDQVDQKGALALADSIRSFPTVKTVSYVNKAMALDAFRQHFGDEALQVLEVNPLPASLRIEFQEKDRTFSRVKQLAPLVANLPGVVEVEYGQQWLSKLDRLLSTVGAMTLILAVILAFSSVLVVATTIKLAFHMRKESVEIMKLVGAAPGFIARPFVLEGAIYGFLGALFGLILLGLLYGVLSSRMAGVFFLPPALLVGLLILGTFLGSLGSVISLRAVRR